MFLAWGRYFTINSNGGVCRKDFCYDPIPEISRVRSDNFCPKWPLERSCDLSTFLNSKKYLKSVHLKLTTCCSKNYPVVFSFSTYYQNFEYNSKPQSQKIPNDSIPQSQKFSSKSISQSQNFQAKTTQNWRTSPSYPIVKYPPPRGFLYRNGKLAKRDLVKKGSSTVR